MPYIGNIVQDFSVNNAMLNTDSVTSIKIDDGTIVNADINDSAAIAMSKLALSITNSEINASAAIAGTKISPDFGSQNIVTTGSLSTGQHVTLTGENPRITFADSNHNPDFEVYGSGGKWNVYDSTNGINRLIVNSDGHVDIAGNLDVGAGIDVTGDITSTGSATIGTDLIHAGDTDTKLSFGDNEITLNTAGSERLELDVDETTFNDGGSDTDFRIRTPAQTHMFFINAGDNQIGIKTSSLQSGAVLTVNGRCHLDTQLTLGSNSTLDAGAQATIYKPATNTLAFATAGANERMRIDSSGNVGIGTSSPNAKFVISDSSTFTAYGGSVPSIGDCMQSLSNVPTSEAINNHATIQFGVNGGSHNRVNSISAVAESASNRKLAFAFCTDSGSNRNERMRISADGNVGIGTASPTSTLQVDGDIRTTNRLGVGTAANFANIVSYISGTGSYPPSGGLVQADNADSTAMFWNASNSANYTGLSIECRTTGAAYWMLANVYNSSFSGDLAFRTRTGGSSNAERVRFLRGGGITFNGDTSSDNALDDYEEGSLNWELAKSGTPSLGSNNGSNVKYVKVGRLVHISGRVRTDSCGSAGGDNFVFQSGSTLPFTPETSGTSVVGHWRSQDQTDNSLTASIAWVGSSTTLYLYTIDAKNDYAADTNNVPADSQTNLVITFSLTYRANS